jgi:hypothetical protein
MLVLDEAWQILQTRMGALALELDILDADWIIDLGPGAGHDGGRIVFERSHGRPHRRSLHSHREVSDRRQTRRPS